MTRPVVAGNALGFDAEKRGRNSIRSEIPGVLHRIALLNGAYQEIRRRRFIGVAFSGDQFRRDLRVRPVLSDEVTQVLVKKIAAGDSDEIVEPAGDLELVRVEKGPVVHE